MLDKEICVDGCVALNLHHFHRAMEVAGNEEEIEKGVYFCWHGVLPTSSRASSTRADPHASLCGAELGAGAPSYSGISVTRTKFSGSR